VKSIRRMTQAELGAFVQTHLRTSGIEVVLSGGAGVTLYSRGKYVSKDLDLVNIYSRDRKTIRFCMMEIGFREHGRYFKHPDSDFIIEFPPGPLTVGTEPVKDVREIVLSTGILRVISPTDCVKDRLAAFYHWGDNQCLAQAAMVCKEKAVDLQEVARWSKAEGKSAEFDGIRDVLMGKRKMV
jgi:hypothetical protein